MLSHKAGNACLVFLIVSKKSSTPEYALIINDLYHQLVEKCAKKELPLYRIICSDEKQQKPAIH
jgi:hypothetical protein